MLPGCQVFVIAVQNSQFSSIFGISKSELLQRFCYLILADEVCNYWILHNQLPVYPPEDLIGFIQNIVQQYLSQTNFCINHRLQTFGDFC